MNKLRVNHLEEGKIELIDVLDDKLEPGTRFALEGQLLYVELELSQIYYDEKLAQTRRTSKTPDDRRSPAGKV